MPNTESEIVPSVLAVRLDETSNWDADFLKKYRIEKVFGVYVYNRNRRVHCCEMTASYELNFVESQFEFEAGFYPEDQLSEEIDDLRIEAEAGTELVSYYHCHSIDKIPVRRKRYGKARVEQFHILTAKDCREQEMDNDAAVESAYEYCRGNSI